MIIRHIRTGIKIAGNPNAVNSAIDVAPARPINQVTIRHDFCHLIDVGANADIWKGIFRHTDLLFDFLVIKRSPEAYNS